ncbi:MAG: hypothetical protein SH850_00265 [Planctomycetaceae bacterium]|nr:hypothetical protein [Planctomycetaceae bacterium]
MTAGTPDWLQNGRGALPSQSWSFAADARLADVHLARESGDVLLTDDSGGMYLLDRRGRVQALTRTSHVVKPVVIADDGSSGAAILDAATLAWFDRKLQFRWTKSLPDEAVGLDMSAHGTHVIVSLASGLNVVYDADKQKMLDFEAMRPLRFVQLLTKTPAIVAAADYGFFARYSLDGQPEWTERLWSTVADIAVTGDGNTIALAALAHGIQIYDGEGTSKGSFVLDGTAHLISSTYAKKRWATATLEKQLLMLDSDGDLKWMVTAPDDVARLELSPFGDWLLVGFAGGRVVRLDCA